MNCKGHGFGRDMQIVRGIAVKMIENKGEIKC